MTATKQSIFASGKGFFTFPLLFALTAAVSCTSPTQWEETAIHTSKGLPDLNRVSVAVPTSIATITVEVRTENAYPTLYCSRTTQTFRPLRRDESLAEVTLSTAETSHKTIAHRLAGGQRLKFDATSLDFLIKALASNKSCTVAIANEEFEIPSTAFSKHYKRIGSKT